IEGTVLLGKHYVKMGEEVTLAQNVYLDVNKAHVVFVCGKRGSGKCLTGDSIVTLADGRLKYVKDLEKEETQILALNHDLKITHSNKTEFFKRTVNKILRITLRSGREIGLTPEHPLLTINGWMPTENLTVGSRIATPRKLPSFGSKNMPEHEIKILAYMIAEGHTKMPLFFTNSDEKIVRDLEESIKIFAHYLELTNLNKNYCYKINSRQEKRKWKEKRKIREFFEKHKVYGKLAVEKEIPEEVMQLPKNKLALFLSRLFSCDGSIFSHNGWAVSYCSSSRKMIYQIQNLLLRFEILSRMREKTIKNKEDNYFRSYELELNSINVVKFINEIGFFGKKEERMQEALNHFAKIKMNPNVDTVPKEIWNTFKPDNWAQVGRALNYRHPKAMRESTRYSPSRQKLLQIAEVVNNDRLKLLAQSDIFWDEIVSIGLVEGEQEVYDITVPELHNFVANDIIVHNSYSISVIAEGIKSLPKDLGKKISVIMLDTMGVFWTMKYPNNKDIKLLSEWGLKPEKVDITIYTPEGHFEDYKNKKIPTDKPFSIKPSELNPEDWWNAFELHMNDPLAVYIERIILTLQVKQENFSIKDIIHFIQHDEKEEKQTRQAAINRFTSAEQWGLFSEKGTPIKELVKGGEITVLDMSPYAVMPNGWKIKCLAMGFVCSKLFIERMKVRKEEEQQSIQSAIHFVGGKKVKSDLPNVWICIDECHEFLPRTGKTGATDSLLTLLREGRQPGIALVLATQQPGKIHTDAMTQSDVILAHKLTAKVDTEALGSLMQSYLRKSLDIELQYLPGVPGACLAIDDVNEKIFPMRVKPRVSWHGGGAPDLLEQEKGFLS
ncbi:DUF87 domain-containing protein, partial [archaeon]|nr:DUF87 domain-containing protein [archaeon]